jgi:hypothetical protein
MKVTFKFENVEMAVEDCNKLGSTTKLEDDLYTALMNIVEELTGDYNNMDTVKKVVIELSD